MRQQVDADHGSNLRIASPQATMSDGASCARLFALIFEDTSMFSERIRDDRVDLRAAT